MAELRKRERDLVGRHVPSADDTVCCDETVLKKRRVGMAGDACAACPASASGGGVQATPRRGKGTPRAVSKTPRQLPPAARNGPRSVCHLAGRALATLRNGRRPTADAPSDAARLPDDVLVRIAACLEPADVMRMAASASWLRALLLDGPRASNMWNTVHRRSDKRFFDARANLHAVPRGLHPRDFCLARAEGAPCYVCGKDDGSIARANGYPLCAVHQPSLEPDGTLDDSAMDEESSAGDGERPSLWPTAVQVRDSFNISGDYVFSLPLLNKSIGFGPVDMEHASDAAAPQSPLAYPGRKERARVIQRRVAFIEDVAWAVAAHPDLRASVDRWRTRCTRTEADRALVRQVRTKRLREAVEAIPGADVERAMAHPMAKAFFSGLGSLRRSLSQIVRDIQGSESH